MKKYHTPFVVIIIILLGLAYSTKPLSNWDNIGYAGAVLQIENKMDYIDIHQQVFESVKNNASPRTFKLSIGEGEEKGNYRKVVYENPKSHKEIIHLYKLKILYVLHAYVLYKFKVPLALCAVYVSIIFYILTSISFYFFCKNLLHINISYIAILALAIATSPTMRLMATLSSPDMMSCFFVLLSSYLVIKNINPCFLFLSLCLAIWTRPDNAIYATILISALYFFKSNIYSAKNALLGITTTVTSFLFINYYIIHPSWSVWFFNTFIESLNYPLSEPTHIDTISYLKTLLKKCHKFIYPTLILSILLSLIYQLSKISPLKSVTKALLTTLITSLIIRFLIFPSWDIRFYFVYFLIFLLIILSQINRSKNKILLLKNT